MRKVVFTIVLSLLLVVAAACGDAGNNNGAGGQVPETGQQAVQQQVDRGNQVFQARCQQCHVEGGAGGDLNAQTLAEYGTAQALYNYTSSTMPLDDPGSLSEQEYWDVTAHMLSATGQLDVDEPLGPNNANMTID
jgi:mono/diheme cytochrome c family protein